MNSSAAAGMGRAMALKDKALTIYNWDRFPRTRTALSIALALPVALIGYSLSFTFEGPLRYGPYLLCVVAVAAAIARPCNRAMLVGIVGPLAFGGLGALFIVFALSIYATLATIAAACRRVRGSPYSHSVWPDLPPGRLRKGSVATAVGCGVLLVSLGVVILR